MLAVQPQHAAALLAKSQLVIERTESTPDQITQAHRDVDAALKMAPTVELRAEAHYVWGLAWLKYFVANRDQAAAAEASLVKMQATLLEAVKLAAQNAEYRKFAEQIYKLARDRIWQDPALRGESERLAREFDSLPRSGTR